MLQAARSYDFLHSLDEGAYGCVFACTQRPSGLLCAVKQCKHHEDPAVRRLLLREIRVLRSLPRHPCVVALLDAFRSQASGRPHLVFEHMERSLHRDLDALQGAPSGPVETKLVAWQLVQGLLHLHDHRVVHRDLKPANVLLSGQGAATVAKLCDFGFARTVSSARHDAQEKLSSYVVTRWYRAPEVLVGDKYGMASDIWSLGCTLAEIAAGGNPLLPGASTLDQLARIMRCCGPLPPGLALTLHAHKSLAPLRKPPPRSRSVAERLKGVDLPLLALISACLTVDPLRRPSARALLQAPYFHDVPSLLPRGSPLAALLLPPPPPSVTSPVSRPHAPAAAPTHPQQPQHQLAQHAQQQQHFMTQQTGSSRTLSKLTAADSSEFAQEVSTSSVASRWASTISEPPPRPGFFDRSSSIGIAGQSAPSEAEARRALLAGGSYQASAQQLKEPPPLTAAAAAGSGGRAAACQLVGPAPSTCEDSSPFDAAGGAAAAAAVQAPPVPPQMSAGGGAVQWPHSRHEPQATLRPGTVPAPSLPKERSASATSGSGPPLSLATATAAAASAAAPAGLMAVAGVVSPAGTSRGVAPQVVSPAGSRSAAAAIAAAAASFHTVSVTLPASMSARRRASCTATGGAADQRALAATAAAASGRGGGAGGVRSSVDHPTSSDAATASVAYGAAYGSMSGFGHGTAYGTAYVPTYGAAYGISGDGGGALPGNSSSTANLINPRPGRDQRVAAGGQRRTVRASSSMVDFTPGPTAVFRYDRGVESCTGAGAASSVVTSGGNNVAATAAASSNSNCPLRQLDFSILPDHQSSNYRADSTAMLLADVLASPAGAAAAAAVGHGGPYGSGVHGGAPPSIHLPHVRRGLKRASSGTLAALVAGTPTVVSVAHLCGAAAVPSHAAAKQPYLLHQHSQQQQQQFSSTHQRTSGSNPFSGVVIGGGSVASGARALASSTCTAGGFPEVVNNQPPHGVARFSHMLGLPTCELGAGATAAALGGVAVTPGSMFDLNGGGVGGGGGGTPSAAMMLLGGGGNSGSSSRTRSIELMFGRSRSHGRAAAGVLDVLSEEEPLAAETMSTGLPPPPPRTSDEDSGGRSARAESSTATSLELEVGVRAGSADAAAAGAASGGATVVGLSRLSSSSSSPRPVTWMRSGGGCGSTQALSRFATGPVSGGSHPQDPVGGAAAVSDLAAAGLALTPSPHAAATAAAAAAPLFSQHSLLLHAAEVGAASGGPRAVLIPPFGIELGAAAVSGAAGAASGAFDNRGILLLTRVSSGSLGLSATLPRQSAAAPRTSRHTAGQTAVAANVTAAGSAAGAAGAARVATTGAAAPGDGSNGEHSAAVPQPSSSSFGRRLAAVVQVFVAAVACGAPPR